MKKISVIIPCFNEEAMLPIFYKEITKVLKSIKMVDYELLFIDDGSKDQTLEIIKQLNIEDDKCNYISFSRNFGKEAAMLAGLKHSVGDYTVIMDADLQHPPELLPKMFQVLEEGIFDCCGGKREDRKGEGKIRNFLSHSFYRLIKKTSKLEMNDGEGDFRMLSRGMVNSILELSEYNRYMKGIFAFIGFDTKWIEFNNVTRAAGVTKWSFPKLFSYACEGIFSFTTTPLVLAGVVSITLFALSFIVGVYIGIEVLIGNTISGYTMIACLGLFLSGLQMLFINILSQYMSKVYIESKHRPIYIIKEYNKNEKITRIKD